jgi:hypothetical protein
MDFERQKELDGKIKSYEDMETLLDKKPPGEEKDASQENNDGEPERGKRL